MQKEQQIDREEMVEGWPVCSGWLTEMIHDFVDFMHGNLVQGALVSERTRAGDESVSALDDRDATALSQPSILPTRRA